MKYCYLSSPHPARSASHRSSFQGTLAACGDPPASSPAPNLQSPSLQPYLPPSAAAVKPPISAVRPLFSTIPCNSLYPLANAVLPCSMLSSLSTSPANSSVNSPSLSCFLATLADKPQLTENSPTLSPVPATLTGRAKHNPFVCHSYRKHPGWGIPLATRHYFDAQQRLHAHSSQGLSLQFPVHSRCTPALPNPHGTNLPPARLHWCGGDVHA